MVVVFLMAPLASLVVASLRRGDSWGLQNYRALNTTGARNALLVPATEGLVNSLDVRAGREPAGSRCWARSWRSSSRGPRAAG